jgi:hypothetical protein
MSCSETMMSPPMAKLLAVFLAYAGAGDGENAD